MKKQSSSDNSASKEQTTATNKKVQLSDQQIANLADRLYQKFKKEERELKYAPVKEVLSLLGHGFLLTTLFMAPNAGRAIKSLLKEEKDWNAWKRYNPSYLKRTIKSLEKQKDVKIKRTGDGQFAIVLTDKGKRRILKCAIDELKIDKPRFWDGKWRLVLYDLPIKYKGERDFLRQTLRRLGFYQFQESVYIYPYECQDEIEYLRSFLAARQHIRILTIDRLEHDRVFREYFGLD